MMTHRRQTSRLVSTKRTFKINRPSAPKPVITSTETNPTTSSSIRSSSPPGHNGTQNQSINQNYSSRNSLRSAQSKADIKPSPDTKGSPLTESQIDPAMIKIPHDVFDSKTPLRKGVESTSKYAILNSECFVNVMGDTIICLLCGKRTMISTGGGIDKHLESLHHNQQYCRLRSCLFSQLPDDSSLQTHVANEILTRWYKSHALTNPGFEKRLSVIEEFKTILQTIDTGSQCRVIGSLKTRTSLINSDINLELVHPNSSLFLTDPRAKNSIHHKLIDPNAEYGFQINNHTLHYDLIPNAANTLFRLYNILNTDHFKAKSFEILSSLNDLNDKVPRLILRHIPSLIELEVICYAESSHKLADLLSAYLSYDSRAIALSILVKYWAKMCSISNPHLGTFPPDTFIILVIYYLQRVSPPILPCLHEMASKQTSKRDESSTKEIDATIKKLERFELDATQCNSNSNEIKHTRNGKTTSSDLSASNLQVGCLVDVRDDEDEEELEEEEEEEEEDTGYIVLDENVKNLRWNSSNKTQIADLFIDFLRCMITEFDDISTVITIRTLKKINLYNKKWGTLVKSIENPVKPKVNISRGIGTIRTFDYIKNCLRRCYFYLTSLPLDSKLGPNLGSQQDPRDFTELFYHKKKLENYFQSRKKSIPYKKSDCDAIAELIEQDILYRDVAAVNALFSHFDYLDSKSLPSKIADFHDENLLIPKDVASTKFCWLCKRIGHSKQKCPRRDIEKLQSELEVYDINLDLKADFDSSLFKLYKNDLIHPLLAKQHQEVVEQLLTIINSRTNLKCLLQLFGSTVNNLGSINSDLDICMTLKDNSTGNGVNCVEVLKKVYSVLQQIPYIRSIEPILTARVPIIKFKFGRFDIDLSMYNQCATFNSRLLKTYSLIDERVPQLIYLVKRIAKACGIADASRGSLSSYAWSILAIHYLQHTNPPILPVLQESRNKKNNPIYGVNGWNVWFDESFVAPKQLNQLTLTQLFKGFFLYYGSFDFNVYVVSIRKSGLITRFQKNWNSCMMAIEDPFELTFNLSSRLDDPMAIFIINSFAQTYKHIVRIQKECAKQNCRLPVERLFSGRDITGCSPPYRGCRLCHKIGHRIKDCPQKRPKFNQNNQYQQEEGYRSKETKADGKVN